MVHTYSYGLHYQGYVQFKRAEVAEKVLLQPVHKIGDCDVNVKAGRPDQQPDYKSKILQRLGSIDLAIDAALSEPNKEPEKGTEMLTSRFQNASDEPEYCGLPKDAAKLLHDFDSQFYATNVNQLVTITNSNVLKLINDYNIQLKALKLKKLNFPTDLKHLTPLLEHLESLELSECIFTGNLQDMFASCTKLKVLTLDTCYITSPTCLAQAFPNLEEAYFWQNFHIDDKELGAFFELNPTIKKLSLRFNLLTKDGLNTLDSVLRNILHYEEFEFYEEQCPMFLFRGFSYCKPSEGRPIQLKKLKFNFYNALDPKHLFEKFVTFSAPIEELQLENFQITDDAIAYISQINTVKILVLFASELKDSHLIKLAKGLPKLQQLHLRNTAALDQPGITTKGLTNMLLYAQKLELIKLFYINTAITQDDYKTMLSRVRDRPEQIKLEIATENIFDIVNVPETIQRDNRQWITINQNLKQV